MEVDRHRAGLYRSLRHHHNVATMQQSRLFMDRHRSELHHSNWRMGKVMQEAGVKVFQIETTLNTDISHRPPRAWPSGNGSGQRGPRHPTSRRRRHWKRTPEREAKIFQSMESPHQMTGVVAGAVESVHQLTTERVHKQQLVPVEGQTDILTMGIPYICPYNVDSIMNPILVMCTGLGTTSTSTGGCRSCGRAASSS